ncbi:MAG: potassium-transporting ATPase subunit KdpC [Proteobacteria bacterium]|nr:potassium-transporting ATPase subunit KdpC [Pseudomonadota bacterium]
MEKKYLINQLWPLVVLLTFFSFILGILYPGLVMFINQLAFPNLANGSLIIEDRVLGSELIGQPFSSEKFFWSRPSATTPMYNPLLSSGSNLSPANPQLLQNIKERMALLNKHSPNNTMPVPIDLVTASASGLDPHISIASAYYQIPRIAKARSIEESVLYELVNSMVENRQFGFLGEPRVNVVKLNLTLHKADRY